MSKPCTFEDLLNLLGLSPSLEWIDLKDRIFEPTRPFLIESDSGRKAALAAMLVSAVDGRTSTVFVHQHGIFPSSEIQELHSRIRESQGLHLSVQDCPGEIIDSHEGDYLRCILACCLYNFWDISLTTHDRNLLIYMSHDDELVVYPTGDARSEDLRSNLIHAGFRQI